MNTYDHGVVRTVEFPCGKKVCFTMLSVKSSGHTFFHIEIAATHPDGSSSEKQTLDLRGDTLSELALLLGWVYSGGLNQYPIPTEESINACYHS